MQISLQQVLFDFAEMLKARNHVVSENHIKKFSQCKWEKRKINPLKLITPYAEFRELVNYSKRGLTNEQALKEIMADGNKTALNLLSETLNNPPPIITFEINGQLILEDGVKRSLSACYQGIKEIDAYVGLCGGQDSNLRMH